MVIDKDNVQLCRCHVLYIGSAVPIETSFGLDAVQMPLRERYPDDGRNFDASDSILTVLTGGLQLSHVSDASKTTWFPISSLTLCAAVRRIEVVNGATGEKITKFVSLNSPASGGINSTKPAIFTAITRRTVGKKVLECHGFICQSGNDALSLVQAASRANKAQKALTNSSFIRNYEASSRPQSVVERGNSFASRTQSSVGGYDHHTAAEPVSNWNSDVESHRSSGHGYFLGSGNSFVKKYTLERITERARSVSPPRTRSPFVDTRGATLDRFARMRSPPPVPIGPPPMIAVMPRVPVPLHHRMFSPPPPIARYRMAAPYPRDPHMFMPPPHVRRRHHRRHSTSSGSGSRTSSADHNDLGPTSRDDHSSASSSPRQSRHSRTLTKTVANGNAAAESSSEASSRARTPPVDYIVHTSKPRMSRREQHERHERNPSPIRDSHTLPHPLLSRDYPYDYYMHQPRVGYPFYPPHPVPQPLWKTKTKDKRKIKKDKSKKKGGSKTGSHNYTSDVSNDSFGYTHDMSHSDIGFPRRPRDFRYETNQFQNEKAFARRVTHDFPKASYPTAYALNGLGDGEADKVLY